MGLRFVHRKPRSLQWRYQSRGREGKARSQRSSSFGSESHLASSSRKSWDDAEYKPLSSWIWELDGSRALHCQGRKARLSWGIGGAEINTLPN